MDEVTITVVGAGVIGLAVAAELSAREGDLAVVERHPNFGQEISSRNSEVIHAGIYYPADSLKASLCVEGRRLLYDWCEEYQVPHRRIGKLIVARDGGEIALLETLIEQGWNNGAELSHAGRRTNCTRWSRRPGGWPPSTRPGRASSIRTP